MSKKSKKQLIEEGILQGIRYFTKFGSFSCPNDNPVNVFNNILGDRGIEVFRCQLYDFILNEYKDVSLLELKTKSISESFGYVDLELLSMVRGEVIVSYISSRVVDKINSIHGKLQSQSEIIFNELKI